MPISFPDLLPTSFQDFVPASVPDFQYHTHILTCLSTPPVYPPAIRFPTSLLFLGIITLSGNIKTPFSNMPTDEEPCLLHAEITNHK